VAAVVRVQPTRGGDRRSAQFHSVETTTEFADRMIPGLTANTNVRRYVQRWLEATGDYPVLGGCVTLPDEPWSQSSGRVTSQR
jgi:hypothetical protein